MLRPVFFLSPECGAGFLRFPGLLQPYCLSVAACLGCPRFPRSLPVWDPPRGRLPGAPRCPASSSPTTDTWPHLKALAASPSAGWGWEGLTAEGSEGVPSPHAPLSLHLGIHCPWGQAARALPSACLGGDGSGLNCGSWAPETGSVTLQTWLT